jgi:hypothetical protein
VNKEHQHKEHHAMQVHASAPMEEQSVPLTFVILKIGSSLCIHVGQSAVHFGQHGV